MIRHTVANGAAVFAGQVIDLPDEDGGMLLRLGKAERTGDDPQPVAPPPSDAVVSTVDGKPAQKRRR